MKICTCGHGHTWRVYIFNVQVWRTGGDAQAHQLRNEAADRRAVSEHLAPDPLHHPGTQRHQHVRHRVRTQGTWERIYCAIVDPKGHQACARPLGPSSLIFMQLLGKISPNNKVGKTNFIVNVRPLQDPGSSTGTGVPLNVPYRGSIAVCARISRILQSNGVSRISRWRSPTPKVNLLFDKFFPKNYMKINERNYTEGIRQYKGVRIQT